MWTSYSSRTNTEVDIILLTELSLDIDLDLSRGGMSMKESSSFACRLCRCSKWRLLANSTSEASNDQIYYYTDIVRMSTSLQVDIIQFSY